MPHHGLQHNPSEELAMTAHRDWLQLGLLCLLATTASAGLPAQAETYPAAPVKFITQLSAGSGTDPAMRIVIDQLGRMWGQQTVLINQPGAGGAIAARAAATAAPDGHTLYMAVASTFTVLPEVQTNLPFNVNDFVPIGFVLPRVISWSAMDADDLGRMLGWEFSLMVATVRLINSGLLDELPTLKIQVSHFAGGIARYLPRILGLQQREKMGTAAIPRHGRQPQMRFDYYLHHRLFYDCCGRSSLDRAAEQGAEWVRTGLTELPTSQLVFATDYPQAVENDDEVAAYVNAVRALGTEARSVLDSANAEKLIPNLGQRLKQGAA
jgi:Tripartite tricarboxylate transporter family receptor